MKLNIPNSVAVAISVLILAALLLSFAFGVVVHRYRIFPYPLIAEVETAIRWSADRAPGEMPWYYRPTAATETVTTNLYAADDPQLNLVSSVTTDDRLSIRVVDMRGATVHSWDVDWFDIWPEPDHLWEENRPKSRPGTQIHGLQAFPNGDIVFNFETLCRCPEVAVIIEFD